MVFWSELLLELDQQGQNSPQQEQQFTENNQQHYTLKDNLNNDNKNSDEGLEETDFIASTLSGRNKDGRTLAWDFFLLFLNYKTLIIIN